MARKMKGGKAPGPDQIPQEVVRDIAIREGGYVTDVMNEALRRGKFPTSWKEARVVLLEKPAAPEKERSFRPICLSNSLGKLMEKLVNSRLQKEIEARGDLDVKQHGFREGRSTLGALKEVMEMAENARKGAWQHRKRCVLVTLDVANAFNTVPWDGIVNTLESWKIPNYLVRMVDDYLGDRELRAGKGTEWRMSGGVPQGSILGPTLWNLYYDGVLKIKLPEGVKVVAYADDLAVVGAAKTETALKDRLELAIERVRRWLDEKGLRLAAQKTEAVILEGPRAWKNTKLKVRGVDVATKPSIKYLGVHLGRGKNFGAHVKYVGKKAGKVAGALARLMPNRGGAGEKKRKLLGSVVQSVMLYAAPIWGRAMGFRKHRQELERVQRCTALRVARAYRTVSTEALMMVAGITPIGLAVEERTRIHKEGRESVARNRQRTLEAWAVEWAKTTGKAAWTKRMIVDVKGWVERDFGEVGYEVTQMLTGHGCFQAYLKRFKITEDDACEYCGKEDTVEHTFFACPRWEMAKHQAEVESGIESLTPDNVVTTMMRDEKGWAAIEK